MFRTVLICFEMFSTCSNLVNMLLRSWVVSGWRNPVSRKEVWPTYPQTLQRL